MSFELPLRMRLCRRQIARKSMGEPRRQSEGNHHQTTSGSANNSIAFAGLTPLPGYITELELANAFLSTASLPPHV
jgi:hypothetical protein